MSFLETLASEGWAAHTPWLVLAFVVTLVIARAMPPGRRPGMRLAAGLVAGHLVMLLAAAGQRAGGYDPEPALVVAFAFMVFAFCLLGGVVAFRLFLPRIGIELPRILIDIVGAIVVIIAAIAVGKRAGFSVTGIITTSAVLTAVVGFSMQDTLGNIMGGLALQLDNSVKVGDWVSLGPNQPAGKVTEIRWRYTAIETRSWETIIVPNSVLMKNAMTVLGRRSAQSTLWRRLVEFHVDFRTPPTEVMTAVQDALRADRPARVAAEPPPVVLFHGIDASYARYGVVYWLADLSSDWGGDSDVRVRIHTALRRAGLQFSIPAQALFVTEESLDRATRKQAEELERRTRAFDAVDLFRPVPDGLRQQLVADMAYAPFARGEAVTREGTTGDDCLYVIVSGQAAVRLGGPEGRQVATLGSGHFFGEMSLMTGEKRSATVIAATDLVCYRVDKPAFERILREHPALADDLAGMLAERRAALDAVKGELAGARQQRVAREKDNLLGRIRGFFGLFDAAG